ncbi:hypothetical protein HK104_009379 [Borealophlyctis nickersoniae]|nr:hypothetical protein HK104_009379 [Borealophlyctis nickersoniae]
MPLYELLCIARKTAVAGAKAIPSGATKRILGVAGFGADKAGAGAATSPGEEARLAAAEQRAHRFDQPKAILRMAALHVLDSGGVVRKFENLGDKALPYRMKRHQEIFSEGIYCTMLFDSSVEAMDALDKMLKFDERVIRHTLINAGDSLTKVTSYAPPENLA